MSVINNGILLGAGADAAVGYQISRSLRFNSADSAYLNRTPGSAGNRDLWTLSFWVKRCKLGSAQDVFSVGTSGTDILYFDSSDRLCLDRPGATVLVTTQVFRDPSAWYHIVLRIDSTNGTNANKARMYVNGSEITTFSTDNRSGLTSSSFLTNTAVLHTFGVRSSNTSTNPCDIYLADIHMADGSSLDPTSFTETDAITGQLIPKAFTGSYGTNGFRLPFSDNSGTTAATLGKDAAGSNNWTPNNFSVASGAGNDSLVDSPTGYGTDTGAGNEARGNYATLNPLASGGGTLSNGNLDLVGPSSAYGSRFSTIGVSSGKWYCEATTLTNTSTQGFMCGVTRSFNSSYVGSNSDGYSYHSDSGNKYNNGSASSYGASYASDNTVIGIALDLDAGTVTFYKNGVSQGTAFSSLASGTYYFGISCYNTQTACINFGQRAFAYTAPSGYKALCSHNLPEPTILQGNTAMDVSLYTGNSSVRSITGFNFSPDFVWIKPRSVATQHNLYDAVRGATKALFSDFTDAEATVSNGLTAFNSDGFSLGSNQYVNDNAVTFVAWAWDAGSSTVTNTSGSISSQVRASATNGCSVVTYTGTGSNATVGHGLGVAPSLIIGKARSFTQVWVAGHTSIGWGNYLLLNATDASTSSANVWNNTAPTSTVFSLGTGTGLNTSSATYVAYCFAPVAGFSAFGSYTGNGSTDGPFVFTGFRPRWILVKSSSAGGDWILEDAARSNYNVVDARLFANTSDAEISNGNGNIDFLSNGFKLRNAHSSMNASSTTYVYAAFAEAPVKYSRAR
jgi:hypothetical protein